jgi:enterochelin esterase-like enzyme
MHRLLALVLCLGFAPARAANDYALTEDSLRVIAGAATGRVEKVALPTSTIYPGSDHECWVYVPAKPAPASGYALMVFQDGGGYQNRQGGWRVPNVLDNLIHRGELPPMVAVFVNPGVLAAPSEQSLPRYNRSFEYDSVDDRYARFLVQEVLPAVGKLAKISDDPNQRGIAGSSSGGICAFNAAFQRPDLFRRVFCTIGTFVGLRGGDELSTLVRKVEPLPIRVFLQDGRNDNNIYAGDWWMENQTMQRALEWAGYDHQFVWGDGGHDGKQGGQVMPEALRWLWRDAGQPLKANPSGKSQLLAAKWTIGNEEWHPVDRGLLPPQASRPPLFDSQDGPAFKAHGLSPDKTLLYGVVPGDRHIWSWSLQDRKLRHGQPYFYLHTDIAGNTGAVDLQVDRDGRLYVLTSLGIQICDQPGRVNAILRLPPNPKGLWQGLEWVGEDRNTLVVEGADNAVGRKMAIKGQRDTDPAVKPEKPRL